MTSDVPPRWSIDRAIGHLRTLVDSGVLGSYGSVEVTELIGTPPGGAPTNVFSVFVLEPDAAPAPSAATLLPSERIRADGYRKWRFGVWRSRIGLDALFELLERYERDRVWRPIEHELAVGELDAQPPMFVPSGGSKPAVVTGLLKNNFWNGSHVLELALNDKTQWEHLLADAQRLQAFSAKVRGAVPWELTRASDFLGNVLIQVPVTSVVADVSAQETRGEAFDVTLTWHPSHSPRLVRATSESRHDGALLSSVVSEAFTEGARLASRPRLAATTTTVWDEATGIVLAAEAPAPLIMSIGISSSIMGSQRRRFSTTDNAGDQVAQEVKLEAPPRPRMTGEGPDAREAWRRRRIRAEEADRLASSLAFKQYRPSGDKAGDHARAIHDIRTLLSQHSSNGAWLWDPYLSAKDILETLFFCPYSGAELRALSALKTFDDTCGDEPQVQATLSSEQQRDGYRTVLEENAGDMQHLNLEFRVRIGEPGWRFHDRFLIFPGAEHVRAWSLGTSINSVGHEHHILQETSNPALIASAFEELWNELDGEQQRVWKSS